MLELEVKIKARDIAVNMVPLLPIKAIDGYSINSTVVVCVQVFLSAR